MIERFYNLPTIYEMIAIVTTIVAFFYHPLSLFAFIFDLMGILILLWEIYGPSITMKFAVYYDDFKKGFREELWERRIPFQTWKRDSEAVELRIDCNVDKNVLGICALKRDVGLEGPLKWEGPEIVARKNGYNLIMAKISLNFKESTAKEGNIYLSALGYLGRFQYLIGIDKSSRDVFFHIWDKKAKATYGSTEVGAYIKERGRTHLKDYLDGLGEKWLILGIEWSLEGPKFFAFKEGEKNVVKIPANPPPELREEILKDSRWIYFYGLSEFGIRMDLVAENSIVKRSIKGAINYVKVKTAPHHWMRSIFNIFLKTRVLFQSPRFFLTHTKFRKKEPKRRSKRNPTSLAFIYFKELLEALSVFYDTFAAELLEGTVLAFPLGPFWCFLFFD